MAQSNYDAWRVTGNDRKGEYYESQFFDSPGKARAVARRKGGKYNMLSRIAQHCGNRGMWSGGECGEFK
jgi:hypothetical protein